MKDEVKIKKVNNGYIIEYFDSTYRTEVYKRNELQDMMNTIAFALTGKIGIKVEVDE